MARRIPKLGTSNKVLILIAALSFVLLFVWLWNEPDVQKEIYKDFIRNITKSEEFLTNPGPEGVSVLHTFDIPEDSGILISSILENSDNIFIHRGKTETVIICDIVMSGFLQSFGIVSKILRVVIRVKSSNLEIKDAAIRTFML